MSGLKRTFRRLGNLSLGKGYATSGERKRKRVAKANAAQDKIYQAAATIPDAEVLKRDERRKAAKRSGSRANTVLTDRLGG